MLIHKIQRAAMRGNDIVTHCQPKASATFLGTEKRLKNIISTVLRDARACILENDFNPVFKLAGANQQFTTGGHGIEGIQDQIKKYLLDLAADCIYLR